MSTRKPAVADAFDALRAKRPAGRHPDEIVAMLDAVPDLRSALTAASDEELVEISGRTRSGLKLKLDRGHPGEASGSPIASSARERATATDSART